MKKIRILLVCLAFIITGCGKSNPEDVFKNLKNSVEKTKSYKLSGTMEINNDEESFIYSLDVNYLKDDYYKVTLINQTNNHDQIILKNKDDVYVITPSLNKSFKFQSEWPDNSSQAYLINNIVKDIEKDKNHEILKDNNGYVIKSKVNYPNNLELIYQKVYLDNDKNIKMVEVYNDSDIVKIKVSFSKIDLNANIKEKDFDVKEYLKEDENNSELNKEDEKNKTTEECKEESCKNDKKTASIENIIYPLYIPSNTYLTNSEKLQTERGERVILTFTGAKNFVLIEEAVIKNDNMEIVPVYGEPLMLSESIGALSQNSLRWDKGNMTYYLASTELSIGEMLKVANSLGNSTLVSNTK